MSRTIKDIQKDIELLGVNGGYDVEQLLTPQDCRRLSYEIERLNNIINELEKYINQFPSISYASAEVVNGERLSGVLIPKEKVLDKLKELRGEDK